jgi:hypothetical protein
MRVKLIVIFALILLFGKNLMGQAGKQALSL